MLRLSDRHGATTSTNAIAPLTPLFGSGDAGVSLYCIAPAADSTAMSSADTGATGLPDEDDVLDVYCGVLTAP